MCQGTPEVFHNGDSLVKWKFNSSDMQAELKEGSTYDAVVTGWRIPFLSWYRKVISVNEVQKPESQLQPQIEQPRQTDEQFQQKIEQLQQQIDQLRSASQGR